LKKNDAYRPPVTVTRRALLVNGSDIEFRRLIYRMLLVEDRLLRVRDFLGRRVGVSGPQYMLLITVAILQGSSGIAVRSLARNLRVSSAFITAESHRLVELGLLAKRRNPADSRSVLVTMTPEGRRRIDRLLPELRRVNNAFFAHVTAQSFRHALGFLDQLLTGSEQVMAYIDKHA
jgi:MarR family transcriptional regulator, organic hydroperoxide resistance regulator